MPAIKKDAMEGNGPFKASKDIQQSLGFPREKVNNWQQVAIDKIAETKSKYRSVQVFLDAYSSTKDCRRPSQFAKHCATLLGRCSTALL